MAAAGDGGFPEDVFFCGPVGGRGFFLRGDVVVVGASPGGPVGVEAGGECEEQGELFHEREFACGWGKFQ